MNSLEKLHKAFELIEESKKLLMEAALPHLDPKKKLPSIHRDLAITSSTELNKVLLFYRSRAQLLNSKI